MQAKLQRVEVKSIVLDDDDLPIQHAARRQDRTQRIQELREIAVERLFVATLDQDLIPIAKHQRPKAVPFGLENPIPGGRQFTHALGQHGQERGIDGKVHRLMVYRILCFLAAD
jgi:hypothetical protein